MDEDSSYIDFLLSNYGGVGSTVTQHGRAGLLSPPKRNVQYGVRTMYYTAVLRNLHSLLPVSGNRTKGNSTNRGVNVDASASLARSESSDGFAFSLLRMEQSMIRSTE